MVFFCQNLGGKLKITTCLSDRIYILLEVSEFQFVEMLKIMSHLRVFDFLNLLHIGVEDRLHKYTFQYIVAGFFYVSFS